MPAVYILIHLNVAVDFADSLRDIRAVDGVERADLVVGPDDCIAFVQADDKAQLMNTLRAIRSVDGVARHTHIQSQKCRLLTPLSRRAIAPISVLAIAPASISCTLAASPPRLRY